MSTDAPAVLPHPAQSGLISRCPRFTPDAKMGGGELYLTGMFVEKIIMLNLLHSGVICSPSFPPAILLFDSVDALCAYTRTAQSYLFTPWLFG